MKLNLYTYARKWKDFAGAPEIFISPFNSHKSDAAHTYVLLQTTEVEVPDIEIDIKAFTIAQIEQLQDEVRTEKAESYLRVVKLKETIQSLMCLEQK